MIEMDVFKDLNEEGLHGTPSDDLLEDRPPPQPDPSFWSQVFGPCCGAAVSVVYKLFCLALYT